MSFARRLVNRVAILWVLAHAVSLSASAATLWPGPQVLALDCTCTHTDHGVCPMHRRPAPGSKRCALQAATPLSTAALTSVFTAGLLPVSMGPTAEHHAARPEPVRHASVRSLRPAPPDPPPPRP